MNRQDMLDLGLIGKKRVSLENGVYKVWTIQGANHHYQYKTEYAAQKMFRRMGACVATGWQCPTCEAYYKNQKWAEKHVCKNN